MILEKTLHDLEYDKIIEHISTLAHSAEARDRLLATRPQETFAKATELLDTTRECTELITGSNISPYFSCADITEMLTLAKKGSLLTIKQLYDIKQFTITVNRNIGLLHPIDPIAFPYVTALASKMTRLDSLESRLQKAIANESEIADDATPELLSIRSQMTRITAKIGKRLKAYTAVEASENKYLQSSTVSIRENRYVIPLKAEFKGRIKGIIHDQSSSGATLFVEPMDIFDLNNDLREQQLLESAEITKILTSLTQAVVIVEDLLASSFYATVTLDTFFAKANYALNLRCVYPRLNNNGYINLLNARHPLIDAKKVVPISIRLGKDYRLIVISGPNTGGKTVSMKTVGLLTLLAESGIFIHADEGSELAFFDAIFTDIGDSQSIENDLSTFSSHVVNLVNITGSLTQKSLVLLDEIGGGTEPSEGAALAIAITEFLGKSNARGIVTTHYNALKVFTYTSGFAVNACMDYDKETMSPTYRLLIGSAGSSNALEIVRRYGMRSEVLTAAEAHLTNQNVRFEEAIREAERVNRELETERDELVARRHEMEQELKKVKQRSDELDKKIEEMRTGSKKIINDMVSEYMKSADELIRQMKEQMRHANEAGVISMNHIKKRIDALKPEIEEEPTDKFVPLDGEIMVGDSVFIPRLNTTATVKSIRGKTIEVVSGSLSTLLKRNELQRVKIIYRKEEKRSQLQQRVADVQLTPRSYSPELNVIGETVDSALSMVDAYLSDIIKSSLNEVRLVHGKGTFALKNAIWDYLATSPIVKSYRSGKYGEGEIGVTIVTLRK